MFYIGQFILLTITFGLYSGAYLINLYEYFSSRIVEKQGDITTGRIVFRKPLDKGAGFLLLQVFLSFLTMNFYTPFAYVEYIKFFVNNTYLETKGDFVEVKTICSESSAE